MNWNHFISLVGSSGKYFNEMQIISNVIIVGVGRLGERGRIFPKEPPTRKRKEKRHKFSFAARNDKSSLGFICLVSWLPHIIQQWSFSWKIDVVLFVSVHSKRKIRKLPKEERKPSRHLQPIPRLPMFFTRRAFCLPSTFMLCKNASQTRLFSVCFFASKEKHLVSIYSRPQIKQINTLRAMFKRDTRTILVQFQFQSQCLVKQKRKSSLAWVA